MRGNAEAHDLIAPGSLDAVLHSLANEPGVWTPIAGGTELMVAHAAGRLNAKKLVSLWGIRDLCFIETMADSIAIGACTTFRDLRANRTIAAHLPLLEKAASWIGSIANQSRATIGGNLVNGSPAADSSPALLVYDAELELISVRGKRRIPYAKFHTGYKRNALAPDELVCTIHIPLRYDHHRQYLRKVGTRRAMAISKIALAGTALVTDGIVREIRIGAASLAAFPARLTHAEDRVCGRAVAAETVRAARRALLDEVAPIDDIRSTAEYRKQVAANLLEEFLTSLRTQGAPAISHVAPSNCVPLNRALDEWNRVDLATARTAMLACCGATRWADAMATARPILGVAKLSETANRLWSTMREPDWLEAFACHPRIGERRTPTTGQSAAWSKDEQASAATATTRVVAELAEKNVLYEKRFGFTYIVCATGKSAEEMLAILTRRLNNDRDTELREAAEQQRQITQLRLEKWSMQ